MKKKKTIGRKEKADFPDFGFRNVETKIDTGAYTSAIHCHKIEIREMDGNKTLFFTLLDPSHKQYENIELSTTEFKEKRIKSSFGTAEKRFVITSKIKLFGRTHTIEFSLSKRGEMKFPILLGRKFLMGKYVVDPSKYDLSYKLKITNKNLKK